MTETISLLDIQSGSVLAPAGCGKTELIATSLAGHTGSKPVLILTHTNAGVSVLQQRMLKHSIPKEKFRIATIDGWAKRAVGMFPWNSGYALDDKSVLQDYPRVLVAALQLVSSGNIDSLIRATYARLVVDEYQDCSLPQHALVTGLAKTLPTVVLGDPLQAIFSFPQSPVVSWSSHVQASFRPVAQLEHPWRWINAQSQPLGEWLIQIRAALFRGDGIDISARVPGLEWAQLANADDFAGRLQAAAFRHPDVNSILVLAEAASRHSQQNVAKGTPGASRVERVDLPELTTFAGKFVPGQAGAFALLLDFATDVMTKVDAKGLAARMATLRNGRESKEASPAERAALEYESVPSWKNAARLLRALADNDGARIFRPAIYYSCLTALRSTVEMGKPFVEAAVAVREGQRFKSRPLPQRAVGSTLLMKGLEADAAVVLYPESMDICHLYVALTRGARRVVVASPTSVLTPRHRPLL